MKSFGSQLPRMYGLAKVNKANLPIRPKTNTPGLPSMLGSPYYRNAQKVTYWLSVIPLSKINCSSKKIVDLLKTMSLDPAEETISFEVISLYTNVPVNETINEAGNLLFSGKFPYPPIDKQWLN